jgi:glycosyltransferase involved in cell wall biosynthesis
MIDKKVSIVIPTFNRADYLIQCIDSCLEQTHSCEIIVCDHGSSDNTPEVIKQYGDRIKYVRRELDSGVHFCWLDGILHASNDLIHINFDDDWIKPTFIERCLELFNEQVGCVITEANVFFENEKKYSENIFNLNNNSGIYPVENLINFNLKSLTSPCSGIYRKKILIDNLFVGSMPYTINEYHGVGPDILFTLMSCYKYPFYGYIYEPLVIFRAHEKSITIDASLDSQKQLKIDNAYEDARIYFLINRFIDKLKVYSIVRKYFKIRK